MSSVGDKWSVRTQTMLDHLADEIQTEVCRADIPKAMAGVSDGAAAVIGYIATAMAGLTDDDAESLRLHIRHTVIAWCHERQKLKALRN